jgi:hypothetical protein
MLFARYEVFLPGLQQRRAGPLCQAFVFDRQFISRDVMILRRLTTLGLAGAIAVGQVGEAHADAKDFVGGAIIGA